MYRPFCCLFGLKDRFIRFYAKMSIKMIIFFLGIKAWKYFPSQILNI